MCCILIFSFIFFHPALKATESDSTLLHRKIAYTQNVYKYNWNFTDSTWVYRREVDSTGEVIRTEGYVFFDLPLLSSNDFEWAIANAFDGDTVFSTSESGFTCRVASRECAMFVMKFDENHRPAVITQYACEIKNKKPIGSNIFTNKAVFTYSESAGGKKTVMEVINSDSIMEERMVWVYDKEGRGLMTQWEVPTDGFYYRVYYKKV